MGSSGAADDGVAGGTSGTRNLLETVSKCRGRTLSAKDYKDSAQARVPVPPKTAHMLNHGVTQMYLMVKTSRSSILTGSEIIKIRNVYMVTSCSRLMRL
jgi:hypothetical protein